MVETVVVAADGSDIVWLGRVGVGVVLGEQDALALEVSNVRIQDDLGVVLCGCASRKSARDLTLQYEGRDEWRRLATDLILEPYRDEAIKRLATRHDLELGTCA